MKELLRNKYVEWKIASSLKNLNVNTKFFPVKSTQIKNVLIILPQKLAYLDPAMECVRILCQDFPKWKYIMLDMDKLIGHNINHLHLPSKRFIKELEKENLDLVFDLNLKFDYRIGYLITLLKIPFRITLLSEPISCYNIAITGDYSNTIDYLGFLDYVKTIFV